ncbi:hypothetical protein AB0I02_12720 [Streptomyces phaeochromogenes]
MLETLLAEGHGSRLFDVDGIEYLDLIGPAWPVVYCNTCRPSTKNGKC